MSRFLSCYTRRLLLLVTKLLQLVCPSIAQYSHGTPPVIFSCVGISSQTINCRHCCFSWYATLFVRTLFLSLLWCLIAFCARRFAPRYFSISAAVLWSLASAWLYLRCLRHLLVLCAHVDGILVAPPPPVAGLWDNIAQPFLTESPGYTYVQYVPHI